MRASSSARSNGRQHQVEDDDVVVIGAGEFQGFLTGIDMVTTAPLDFTIRATSRAAVISSSTRRTSIDGSPV
jgi:hypothetical protein